MDTTTTTTKKIWTNEKHLNFLKSMEASFVQTMFENNGCLLPLPLDRYLPDSSESTLDLKRGRNRRYSTSDILDPRVRTYQKNRGLRSHPYNASQDQVVPEFEITRNSKTALVPPTN